MAIHRCAGRGFHSTLACVVLLVAVLSATALPTLAAEPTSTAAGEPDGAAAPFALDAHEASRPPGPARFARSTYVWPYATGPAYGTTAAGAGRKKGTLHTPVGSFDLSRGALPFPEPLQALPLAPGSAGYFIVQLRPDATAATVLSIRREISEGGGAVVGHLPVAARLVRMDGPTRSAVAELAGVTAVVRYHPGFKLDPAIGRVPLSDPLRAAGDTYALDLLVFPREDVGVVTASLERLGGHVVSTTPDSLRLEIDRSRLAEVAGIEAVARVWEHLPAHTHAEETTTTIQTGRYRSGASPYHDAGIRGDGGGSVAGQILMVLDSGIQLDAAELSDTATSPGVAGNDPGNADPSGDHRKVIAYSTAAAFGGGGDLSGCDEQGQGGLTHGHLMAAVAAGNASDNLPASYGDGVRAADSRGGLWDLDGVAPGARLVVYDAQTTPAFASCDDPTLGTIEAGDLYAAPSGGSLGASYTAHGARIAGLSWGAAGSSYGIDAIDIDTFIADKRDAMVFTSAGNLSQDADEDGFPDTGTLASLAAAKNGLTLGASRNGDDFSDPAAQEDRAVFSGVGPTPAGRIAPQLMAPGADGGLTGIPSEFVCTSGDNDQGGAVQCDVVQGFSGTSLSAAAAAGAAALVRDYFAQGFYPGGSPAAGDQLPNISAALLKAMLIASADFMTGANLTVNPAANCVAGTCYDHRGSNLQGWGRIQLDNALPLATWAASPPGLLVVDGGIDGNPKDIAGLSGGIDAVGGDSESGSFVVSDDTVELRVALTWIEGAGDALLNDLDLSVTSPSGVTYQGNYFTDDDDRDGFLDVVTEDCSGPGEAPGQNGVRDAGGFSLPVCTRADFTLPPTDATNPIELIVLSPDPDGDPGTDDGQIETGSWSITVEAASGGVDPAQRYALAVAGGVRIQSGIRFDRGSYVCNTLSGLTVTEFAETGDPAPGAAEVAARSTVQVLDGNGVEVDSEPGSALGFQQPDLSTLRFVAEATALTDGLARDPGNGVLDVRSGDTLRAVYVDVDSAGLPDPGRTRIAEAAVECRVRIAFGSIVFAQLGEDMNYKINGGCERNARGQQEFGFPDRYLDAGENIVFSFAFNSTEDETLQNAEVALRCVAADDALAGTDCLGSSPTGPGCLNPTRALDGPNPHTACAGLMTVRNSPMVIGKVPPGAALASNFNIDMAPSIAGSPLVELVLEVTAETAGKTAAGVVVHRQRLNVDANELFYSTDFPSGGSEFRDRNENELIENPTTNLGDFLQDYRFETVTYGDLTAGGTKNMGIGSPWHFDTNHGNFTSGLGAATDEGTIIDTIAQWGEDKNFNDIDDKRCSTDASVVCVTKTDCVNAGVCTPNCSCDSLEQRDPVNPTLDRNWSTLGGCGWQTKAPGSCSGDPTVGCYTNADCTAAGAGLCTGSAPDTGGIWHTGTIAAVGGGECLNNGLNPNQCQTHEAVSGDTGQRMWFELLLTPEIEKVSTNDEVRVEIVDFAWNMAIDLQDSNVGWSWEVDTDTERVEPVDLITDLALLNFGLGSYGAIQNSSTFPGGGPVFTPMDDITGQDANGTVGNNRAGKNSCAFNNNNPGDLNILGVPRPRDDDLNNGYCADNVNRWCQADIVCGRCVDTPWQSCDDDGDCTTGACDGNVCVFDNGTVDEYVTPNGPLRNFDLFAFNGPDMRFNTHEDLYQAPTPLPGPPSPAPEPREAVRWIDTTPLRKDSAAPYPKCAGGPGG